MNDCRQPQPFIKDGGPETPQGPLFPSAFGSRPGSLDTQMYTLLHSRTPKQILVALANNCRLEAETSKNPRWSRIAARIERCAEGIEK